MGWDAATLYGDDTDASRVDEDATATATEPSTGRPDTSGSKKSAILILAGLVVTGVIAGWDWARRLPRD